MVTKAPKCLRAIFLLAVLLFPILVLGQNQKRSDTVDPKGTIQKALANYGVHQKIISRDFAYNEIETRSTYDYKKGSLINELDTAYEVLDGETHTYRRAIPPGESIGKGKFKRNKKNFNLDAVLSVNFLDKLEFQVQPEGEVVVDGKSPRRFYVFSFQVNEKLKEKDFTDDNVKKALPILNKSIGTVEIWCDNLTFKKLTAKMVADRVKYYAPPVAGGNVLKAEIFFETQDLENGLTVPLISSYEYKYNASFLFARVSAEHVRMTYRFSKYVKKTFAAKMDLVLSVAGQPLYKPHEPTGQPAKSKP